MSCGPCGSTSAISDVSGQFSSFYEGTKFGPALTQLIHALDDVEIRMRTEQCHSVSWRPSQFGSRMISYGKRPTGTEVVAKNTPLYFENNDEFSTDLSFGGTEGGLCEGGTLCSEGPAHQVPGDTYQRFSWSMKETAWETPVFCLKDLLFYENGIETLERFCKRVEEIPAEYYDNYIRNLVWDTGEKYLLANTGQDLMWNSPDRVHNLVAPNINDFRTIAGQATADAGVPTLSGLQHLEWSMDSMMDCGCTPLNVSGQQRLMMVGVKPDIFSMVYNDDTCGPCSFVEGGMGFTPFTVGILDRLPFAFKFEKKWFRGDFDDVTGEFYRIPSHVYVGQNGGQTLVVNPEWKSANYGVLTIMTGNPFTYLRFETLPNMPSKIDEKSKRYLHPRFMFGAKTEVCSYTRGNVQWRAEDEFGFQPTGEKIIHLIYRRDRLASALRSAKSGDCITSPADCTVDIPQSCGCPGFVDCCVTTAPGFEDSAYTLTYDGDIATELGLAVGGTHDLQTLKGVFTATIVGINTAGNMISVGIDPAVHEGAHKCCPEQILGFVKGEAAEPGCDVCIDGLGCDPFDPTLFHAALSESFAGAAGDLINVVFNAGCGNPSMIEATLDSIDNAKKRAVVTFDPALVPDGVPCDDAVKLCTVDCETCLKVAEPCEPTEGLTPAPLVASEPAAKKSSKKAKASKGASVAKETSEVSQGESLSKK